MKAGSVWESTRRRMGRSYGGGATGVRLTCCRRGLGVFFCRGQGTTRVRCGGYLEVFAVLGLVAADAVPEGPLRVRVDVHLHHPSLDRVLDVLNLVQRVRVRLQILVVHYFSLGF